MCINIMKITEFLPIIYKVHLSDYTILLYIHLNFNKLWINKCIYPHMFKIS